MNLIISVQITLIFQVFLTLDTLVTNKMDKSFFKVLICTEQYKKNSISVMHFDRNMKPSLSRVCDI